MSILNFLWLIYQIYFKKGMPDIAGIQKRGLLAVKIGQVHALRIDFLGWEKCQHLTQLYRNTTPIPQEEADRLLEERVKKPYGHAFASIEAKPFASASVGQVHRARLATGEDVVVKILKQDFKKHFIRDVEKVRKLFKLLIFFYPKLDRVGNPLGILDHIKSYTVDELDLRNEIHGQELLKKIADQYRSSFDLSRLAFVKVFSEYSNENVMVTEYLDGHTFDELLEQGKLSYKEMLDLFYIHGFYMFIVGTFHGDIHPGNVILKDGKIYFIDTAAISTTSDRIRKNLFWFFEALSRYDYPTCAKFLNEMAEVRIDGERFERFEKDFIELYTPFTGSTVTQVSLTQQMMRTIKLGVHAGMRFERAIFSIIKSLMYLDGMVRKCKPDAVLMEDMRQFVTAYKDKV